jgi:hypothetical protein
VIYYLKIITLEVIPQIITNDADEFLFVSKYVQNWDIKVKLELRLSYPGFTKWEWVQD